MKTYLFYLAILISFSGYSQEFYYKPKIDTLFFSGIAPKIKQSVMQLLVLKISNLCEKNIHYKPYDDITSNKEFLIISNLKNLDKESKTTIFTDADAVIVASFCQNIEFGFDINLYEFIYSDLKKASLAIQKLNYLHKKIGFRDMIETKNWYFKQKGNKVYFIDSGLKDEYNPMKLEIQKKIEFELK